MTANNNGIELHYTVSEIAQRLKLSEETVRRIFRDEPGTLKIGEGSRLLGGRKKAYKRRYFVLRIPQSVFERWQDRRMHKRPAEAVPLRPVVRDAHVV
jgi:AraC-like DNA-binding protein